MADPLHMASTDGEVARGSFGRGCLFALPISIALWALIALCVEKIF